MMICGLRPSSLKPPELSADDHAAAEEKLSFLLLEFQAYIAKRDNATTAFSNMSDGKQIQVTLCPRRPPRLSYLCVHSPDAAEINLEPTILATEEELILFRVTVGAKGRTTRHTEYYVYQAAGGAPTGQPSLTLVPPPPSGYFFDHTNIGILPYKDGFGYILGGLNRECWWEPDCKFDFCMYDSKRERWEILRLRLSPSERKLHGGRKKFRHDNCKVMAAPIMGEDGGTLAFVDLWRGIVFLNNVGSTNPSVRYVKLPEPLQSNKKLEGDARLYRDIAVVGGDRLKYVELQVHYKASVLYFDQFFRNGWMAATWTLQQASSSLSPCFWVEENRIMDSQNLKVDPELYFKVLPEVKNDEGTTLPPFKGLDVNQPVLSLGGGGDTIYFTAKRRRGEAEGWVICVDLENKELLAASSFASERYWATNFAYIHSRISMHLKYPGEEEKYMKEGPRRNFTTPIHRQEALHME